MVETFEAYFEVWLSRLEGHLQDLLHAIECKENEQRYKALIEQTIALYGEYMAAKDNIARQNVFMVTSPTWFTSFERAHLWIGWFRPVLAFRLIRSNVMDLTKEQSERINRLMEEIKAEEKQVSDEFDRVQEYWIASWPIVEMVRHLRNGEKNKMELVVEGLKMRMEKVVECADYLRKKAAGILVLEILKPGQAVRFLAATASLQLRLRRLGMLENTSRVSAA